ncbi:energy-coupling factor ABC transporter ATP-binding protein [Brevibacterium luteolum]|uniref:energy-coupling factor ABC transporter ATP-binding protein n=1 Tax=Brevibacterium luteolum TaxID=199591 RepID=UPI00223C1C76|nr:ABC transporter ATP-binding protein [Brevibacterium luteolum]MCT1872906.1 energy-coupling factor ABC transporter ATP-binding protein [Brevibacterium luteolum]MCT1890947.1 energy-coupling factor ABC transporter ATP-binding protein [Brevibacterium luteolum]MCT1893493.1 energy-coupling factor ABC transporter ATP-binding protein [Brevibacterium luteolum]MCT1924255.1 energy-coupling factor ABC transporter ATP-binding protein [Brevibacterium luteolum]
MIDRHAPVTGPQDRARAGVVFDDVAVTVEDMDPASSRLRTRALLTDLTLSLTEQHISVIGANGSGKSTFLQLINGLTAPTRGRVRLGDLDTVDDGAAVRRQVGFVFSDPAAQLVMPTPVEDVELSLKRRIRDKTARRQAAVEALAEFGVEDLAERSIYELSSGQRQLVALASVLAVSPTVLVLDEPTTLLDLANRELLRATLDDLAARRGVQLIVSTHNLDFACDAERTLVLHDGRIVSDTAPAEAVAAYRQLIAATVSAARRPTDGTTASGEEQA